jgi:hypothetical protein
MLLHCTHHTCIRCTATFKLHYVIRALRYICSATLAKYCHIIILFFTFSFTPLPSTLAPAPLSISCHSQMPAGSLPYKPFVKPLTMPFDRGEGIPESSRLASVTCEFFLFDFSAEHLQSTFLPVHCITLLHFY